MTRRGRYPAEIRERVVRMVFEHEAEHASQQARTLARLAAEEQHARTLAELTAEEAEGEAKEAP